MNRVWPSPLLLAAALTDEIAVDPASAKATAEGRLLFEQALASPDEVAERVARARAAIERDRAAGTGVFGPRPERQSEIRTYAPDKVTVTFNGIEIKGCSLEFLGGDDPNRPEYVPDFVRAEQQARARLRGSVELMLVTEGSLMPRWWRLPRRVEIRRARRARKLRRGWA